MKQLRWPAAVLALGLSLALSAAMAADPAQIDRPSLTAGTTFRLRVSDVMTKVVTRETGYFVHAAGDAEVVIATEAGEVALVLDGKTLAIKQGAEGRNYEPAYERVRYPVVPGSQWEIKYGNSHPQCGQTSSVQHFKALGWEDVTVPAGSYRALRIESEGTWINSCGNDRMVHRHWVVPGQAVPVRTEELIYAGGRLYVGNLIELISFNPR